MGLWTAIKRLAKKTSEKINAIWDGLAPVVNGVFQEAARTAPKILWGIAKEEVLRVGLTNLKDEKARAEAFNGIKKRLKASGTTVAESLINLAIELYNRERKI